MNAIIKLIVLCAFLYTVQCVGTINDITPEYLAIRTQLATTYPPDPSTLTLVNTMVIGGAFLLPNIKYDAKKVPKEQVEGVLAQWQLPEYINAKFRQIAYTPSTQFQAFNFYDFQIFAIGLEYAGSARYDQTTGLVDMAYIQGSVMLNCLNWMSAEFCIILMSGDPSGVQTVHNILNYAISVLMVESTPTSTPNTKVNAPRDWLKSAVLSTCSVWNPIIADFNNSKSLYVNLLRNMTLNKFENTISINEITALQPQKLDDFINTILARLNLSEIDRIQLVKQIRMTINRDQNTWVVHHLLVTNGNKELKFVSFYTHIRDGAFSSDWIVLSVGQTIPTISSHVISYKVASSNIGSKVSTFTEIIMDHDSSITDMDIRTIHDFLYVMAFRTMAVYFGMFIPNPPI